MTTTLTEEKTSHSTRTIILLHLLPGVAVLAGYAVFAALLAQAGLPNMMGLMLAVLLVEAPLLIWLMRRASLQALGRVDWSWIIPWQEPLRTRTYLLWGVPLVLFSVIVIGGLTPAIGDPIMNGLFGWLPDWFTLRQDPEIFATLSREALWILWAGSLVAFALVGGVMQEVYFRGYLLPRLESLGFLGPVINAGLFAIYHLATPWSWPGFFIMVLPWAIIVRHRRSVRIGIFIHVGMLLVQVLLMGLVLMGVVPMPGS